MLIIANLVAIAIIAYKNYTFDNQGETADISGLWVLGFFAAFGLVLLCGYDFANTAERQRNRS